MEEALSDELEVHGLRAHRAGPLWHLVTEVHTVGREHPVASGLTSHHFDQSNAHILDNVDVLSQLLAFYLCGSELSKEELRVLEDRLSF